MLVVIEGVDGSGKQTQSQMLYDRLCKKFDVRRLTFPCYESDTSALVKMYLGGEFGTKPEDVNAYASSTFYAADRVGSFLKDWGKDYNSGKFILCDRYTTSNAVHQAGKLDGAEKDVFLDWLFDYEYNLLGLPKPDYVFFLDVPPKVSRKLMENRNNKITGEQEKDIHEKNSEYLEKSYNNALYVAKKCGWNVIECVKDGKLRSIEDINDEIYNLVMSNDKL
ncbi:MAG: thymidylate kinase [Clostridia bacterium]|nr:thymidylate kinase [Clostridia bacterium]